ncbi:hypothetical protein J3Q64DRAFT_1711299 [Phycomyces blakesleeanus]|uniref:Uncharacterized protein n=2 Tax=Phycomyces blakesleeanus TaxID=4837 RepID=A0A162THS8_PHYB8|nr:hypothetical protein PHYBLDRAFT_183164 [Phycomyces blakesleeanus NRRL 1555(-)]OAD68692.1 hypothetical protein PHYBLDRAFT_183164 [Phycomyces blakesleeanus NRRL 1555(-)]|eukprot:XP_018286732.1 hypothetical protein PHYBLDRAFT_183164 [Phycomyces blakesleeanus NRRL 1555(-)]
MSERQNRFEIIDGQKVEIDKLGNVKPVEEEVGEPKTRHEKRAAQPRTAVSPPDIRRGRDRGVDAPSAHETTDSTPVSVSSHKSSPPHEKGHHESSGYHPHGRPTESFGNLGYGTTEKKVKQGWGDLVESELNVAVEPQDPKDPASAGSPLPKGNDDADDGKVETLDEYQASQHKLPEKFRKPEPRPPIEDPSDPLVKNAVPFKRD